MNKVRDSIEVSFENCITLDLSDVVWWEGNIPHYSDYYILKIYYEDDFVTAKELQGDIHLKTQILSHGITEVRINNKIVTPKWHKVENPYITPTINNNQDISTGKVLTKGHVLNYIKIHFPIEEVREINALDDVQKII